MHDLYRICPYRTHKRTAYPQPTGIGGGAPCHTLSWNGVVNSRPHSPCLAARFCGTNLRWSTCSRHIYIPPRRAPQRLKPIDPIDPHPPPPMATRSTFTIPIWQVSYRTESCPRTTASTALVRATLSSLRASTNLSSYPVSSSCHHNLRCAILLAGNRCCSALFST